MYILTILLVILILVVVTVITMTLILLTLIPIKGFLRYNLEEYSNFEAIIQWFDPVLKCVINKNDHTTFITVYLFKIKIINKSSQKDSKGFLDTVKLLRTLDINFLNIDAAYGFVDPSITGMIFGLIQLIADSAKVLELNNNADFNSDYDYAKINAFATFNTLSTLSKLIQFRKQRLNSPALHGVK